MPIKVKFSELKGRSKLSRKKIAEATGIRPATITDYYYERVKSIKIKHLEKFCKLFNCSISDILEYIPDDEVK